MRFLSAFLVSVMAVQAQAQGWQGDTFVEIDLGAASVHAIDAPSYNASLSVANKTGSALEDAFERAAMVFGAVGLPEPVFSPRNGNLFGFFTGAFVGIDANDGFITGIPCSRSDDGSFIFISWRDGLNPSDARHVDRNAVHELFHAVQWASPWKWYSAKSCSDPPTWINEGMADAAGIVLMQDALGMPPAGTSETEGEYALRPYTIPLYYDQGSWDACQTLYCDQPFMTALADLDRLNYRTSSFWMFLAERIQGKRVSPENVKAFHYFLSTQPPAMPPLPSQFGRAWFEWAAGLVDEYAGAKPPGSGSRKSAFHYVWAEFLAEYGAWPLAKYTTISEKRWLDIAFGGCEQVALDPGNPSYTLKYDPSNARDDFQPVSGRCVQVLLTDFHGEVQLSVEAQALTSGELDQLQLGMSSWNRVDATGGGSSGNCYDQGRPSRGTYECLMFGKVTEWRGKTDKKNGTKSWRTKKETLHDEWLSQTYVISNVKPDKPADTTKLSGLEIEFSVKYVEDKTGKQGFKVPESAPTAVPDLSTPQRDLLYGIQTRGAYSSLFPMNMSPFGFETLAAAPVKKGSVWPDGEARVVPAFFQPKGKPNPNEPRGTSYGVLPLEVTAFGQLGPIQAVVSRTDPVNPDLPAMSTLCPGADSRKPVEILQSDRAALRARVSTPICGTKTGDMMDCAGGCPVIDTIDVEVTLGGGWRYFSETQAADIITPSVRHDIDRYHHEVYGEPLRLAHLPDLSNVPPGGFPAPGQATAAVGTTAAPPPCDCSCQGLDALKALQKTPALMLLPGNMQKLQCMGTCMARYASCN